MKKSNWPYFIFFFINVAVLLSCYFYPVSRDEFYYLEKVNHPNALAEYYNSYLRVNPRIGQFFSNWVSRNLFLELVFGSLLFNGFISALFLNIYRRFPDLRERKDVRQFLSISAFFILLLSYFGEMFYYTPYSTNYTLTHLFYLIFVFLFTEYYIYQKADRLNRINYFLLILFGLFIGMGNEHIPPVLLLMSFLGGVYFILKNKKLPNLRMIILPISIFIGYWILFFAPANRLKEKTVGRSTFDIGIESYLSNFLKILKFLYYYNIELLLFGILVISTTFIFRKKLKMNSLLKKEIVIYLLFSILPLFIIAVSPLLGTRLLFFSISIFIIFLFKLCIQLQEHLRFKYFNLLIYTFLILFFSFSIMITFHANENYNFIINEIKNEKLESNDVILSHEFNYFDDRLGNRLNRKILLECGEDYIDDNATDNKSMELNLINYYHLNSLKEKK